VRLTVATQICEGMAQLALHGVVHRDLASRNVSGPHALCASTGAVMAATLLLAFRRQPRSLKRMWAQVLAFEFSPFDCARVRVKVTDYGLALLNGADTRGAVTDSNSMALPVRWLAPEALQWHRYSEGSDVWAFGVTLWEVWTNAKVPYCEREADADVTNFVVGEGGRLQRPAECSDGAWAVMQACWETNAGSRPTFEALKLKLRNAYAAAVAAAAQATCVICCERAPAMALQPCGHVCLCQGCVPAVQMCPMCRTPVAGSMRVFV